MSDVFANMLGTVDGAPQKISHYMTLASESRYNVNFGYSVREPLSSISCPVCGEKRELKPSCRRKLFKPVPTCGREVMLSPNVSNLEWDVLEGYAIAAKGYSGRENTEKNVMCDSCSVSLHKGRLGPQERCIRSGYGGFSVMSDGTTNFFRQSQDYLRKKKHKNADSTLYILKPDDFCDRFWLGWPLVSTPRRQDPSLRIHVVMSHCNTEFSYLNAFLGETRIESMTVISKCNIDPEPLPANATVVQTKNSGGCDQSYAAWLAGHNSSLIGDDDIVLFVKDTRILHQYFRRYHTLQDMLEIVQGSGFACGNQGLEPYSFFQVTEILSHFKMRHYKGKVFGNKNNLASFWASLNLTFGTVVPVCYGGMFAATGTRLRAYSKHFWGEVASMLDQGTHNIQDAHYMERTWAALLHEPLPTTVANELYDHAAEIQGCDEICCGKMERCGALVGCIRGISSRRPQLEAGTGVPLTIAAERESRPGLHLEEAPPKAASLAHENTYVSTALNAPSLPCPEKVSAAVPFFLGILNGLLVAVAFWYINTKRHENLFNWNGRNQGGKRSRK